jgi:CRP-like cAMP-binding protein
MDELGAEERARLFERYGRTFASGAVLFAEGEPAETCFLLQEGRVRVVKRVRGSERSLTVLRAGDLLGEDALLPRATRTSTASALGQVSALVLDRRTFATLLAGNGAVAGRVVEQLVRRLRDAEEQLENAMLGDHPSRVVNTLLRLAAAAPPGPDGHVVALSPLELSSRVGLDVDAVKRVAQQLRDGGYLRIVDERIVLPDLDALRRLYVLLGKKEDVRGG